MVLQKRDFLRSKRKYILSCMHITAKKINYLIFHLSKDTFINTDSSYINLECLRLSVCFFLLFKRNEYPRIFLYVEAFEILSVHLEENHFGIFCRSKCVLFILSFHFFLTEDIFVCWPKMDNATRFFGFTFNVFLFNISFLSLLFIFFFPFASLLFCLHSPSFLSALLSFHYLCK